VYRAVPVNVPHPPRIRVAFCLDSFTLGGTELNAVRTAEALDLDFIELRIFHLQTEGPLRARYERLGVRMTHVSIPNLYSPFTARQGLRLARQLREENVDVVHSHDIYCNIFAVPWARLFTSCGIIASRRWGVQASRQKLGPLNRWSSRFAHRVLANSTAVAKLIAREEGVPNEKIVEIPNFLSDDAFEFEPEGRRNAQRRAWGVPESAFIVGIVARLAPVKNHALLLRSLAMLDTRFHVVVIGDGPLRGALEVLARRLGVESRVHFTGEVAPSANLHQFLDVSVLCSVSEGFPNSLIEAMAAARPVVATPVGGVVDAVTHGVTGILFALDDPAALADALRMLEANPARRNQLGEAARAAVRNRFGRDLVIEKLTRLYELLASQRGRATFGRAYG
jgi:glycosyltransferase involved in cell wall biosynthesis